MKITVMPQSMPMTLSAVAGKECQQESKMLQSQAAPAEKGDTEDVTQATMSAALEALRDSPDVNSDKVAHMQALIASGDYPIDDDDLAGAMLGFYRNN